MEKTEKISDLLDSLSSEPGVYLMKDEGGKILYVGKAKNLKNRVRSYFTAQAQKHPKTAYLVSLIDSFETIVSGNEMEALLLENNLIKKHKPKYNIRLRDDKSYPYICLDLSHDFPRAYLRRRPKKSPQTLIFGPYTHASAAHQAISLASKVFLLRDCRDHEFANRERPCLSHQIGQCTAPCVALVSKEEYASQMDDFVKFLNGETQELQANWQEQMERASEEMNFEWAAKLRDRLQALDQLSRDQQRVENAEDLIDRDVWALWPEIDDESVASADFLDLVILQFREGKLIGREHFPIDLEEKICDESLLPSLLLQYYSKKERPQEVLLPTSRMSFAKEDVHLALTAQGENPSDWELAFSTDRQHWSKLMELAIDNAKLVAGEQSERRRKRFDALKALQEFAKLKAEPRRIECIDISNFQGEANVASCVVFDAGLPLKSEYRHYSIKSVLGQDDFGSMREVIRRRFSKKREMMPDLMVVDGGKAQLNAVTDTLQELEIELPCIGLAKARTQRDFKSATVETSEERVFFPGHKLSKAIKNPAVLKLLTQIRDEAHRFAITFHRKKRSL